MDLLGPGEGEVQCLLILTNQSEERTRCEVSPPDFLMKISDKVHLINNCPERQEVDT